MAAEVAETAAKFVAGAWPAGTEPFLLVGAKTPRAWGKIMEARQAISDLTAAGSPPTHALRAIKEMGEVLALMARLLSCPPPSAFFGCPSDHGDTQAELLEALESELLLMCAMVAVSARNHELPETFRTDWTTEADPAAGAANPEARQPRAQLRNYVRTVGPLAGSSLEHVCWTGLALVASAAWLAAGQYGYAATGLAVVALAQHYARGREAAERAWVAVLEDI